VSQFLLGLKEELRHSVEMHLPSTMSQAATLASVQEHLNDKSKPHMKKNFGRPSGKNVTTNLDMWKARQLKEYRRMNNLCFKCGDKYSPSHTCATPTASLHMMEQSAVDGEQILSDDVLTALESTQFYSMQDYCYLSLHAMSVQPQGKAIQLRALVQNQVMVILVDSSSSHTFLNVALAHKLKVTTTSVPQMIVKVANGQSLPCTTEVKQFAWWIQGHTF
jgi:hypothetical protein